MRLDGYDVFFLTGTDEHGIKMQQTAAQGGHDAARAGRPQRRRASSAMVERMNCSNDDFIRTTEARHYASSAGDLGARWPRQRRHLSRRNMPAGTRCATRPITTRTRPRLDDKGVRLGPQGTPVEWVEEESYFFRLSAYQEKLLDALRARSRLRAADGAAQRGGELRARRPEGPVDLAHHLRLGRAGAGRSEARHVCVGRRADQLHHRGRLSRHRQREIQAATGRPTCT